MGRSSEQRYGDIAVIFHWLIALFIIGLLIVGKFMTSLEENDPLRFVLTQTHKSFGITVLVLSVLRVLWRLSHKPPPEPASLPTWQKKAAGGAHLMLYALMFILPITGWVMVSASPLNIDTVLFGVVTLPHIPGLMDLANSENIASSFHHYHEYAGTALIVILLLHIGAALKHHYFDKDTILSRMLPDWSSAPFKAKLGALLVAIGASVSAVYLYAGADNTAALLAAGDSEVSFVADVTGAQTPGIFSDTSVEASIDEARPENTTIVARVQTASLSSENLQVAGSLPDEDWFDVAQYPEALFESTLVEPGPEGTLLVTGDLTIKDVTTSVSFPMTLSNEDEKRVARGEFSIDRQDYVIGMESQTSDNFVGFIVTIKFRFDIAQPSG